MNFVSGVAYGVARAILDPLELLERYAWYVQKGGESLYNSDFSYYSAYYDLTTPEYKCAFAGQRVGEIGAVVFTAAYIEARAGVETTVVAGRSLGARVGSYVSSAGRQITRTGRRKLTFAAEKNVAAVSGNVLKNSGTKIAMREGVKGADILGTSASKTLFRAVGEEECKQILKTGTFKIGPNSLEGKFFAENIKDAQKWGDLLNGFGKSKIIEVKIPQKIADQMIRWERLDGIGSARYGSLDQLNNLKIRVLQ